MNLTASKRLRRVSASGAPAGAILCGCGLSNQGVRIRVLRQQPKGDGGPLQGPLILLDAGDNLHSEFLKPLLNKLTDAWEILRIIRQRHPGRLNIANARILAVEEAEPAEEGAP